MKKIFALILLVSTLQSKAQLLLLTKSGVLVDSSVITANLNAAVALRAVSLIIVTTTDAALTINPNSTVIFPAATLTVSRAATITAGVNTGDRIELLNRDVGFAWTLSGSPIYYSDGVTSLTTVLVNTIIEAKWINGKYQITN